MVPICPDFVIELRSTQTISRTARQDAGVPEAVCAWAGWIQRTSKLRFIVKGRLWKYFSHLLLCQEDVIPGFVLDLSQILVP